MLNVFAILALVALVAGNASAVAQPLFESLGPIVRMPPHTYRGMTGSMVELKDGSLLFALPVLGPSRYTGIVGRKSSDGGRTWSDEFPLQPHIPGAGELIIPCLLRLHNGELLFAYYVSIHGEQDARMYVRRSHDEGKTWTDPLCATPYGCFSQPDKMIQLSTGRIILPTARLGQAGYWISLCYYSDDNGYAWYPSRKPADCGFTTDEPSIVELKDHRLLMIFRTDRGYLGKAYSTDGGETWGGAQLVKELPSAVAPEFVTRIPSTGDLLVLWCRNPHAPGLRRGEDQPIVKVGQLQIRLGDVRSPLSSALSRDEGETWEHVRDIATNPQPGVYADYGYPGCCFISRNGREIAVLNYNALDGIEVTRIGVEWFYGR